MLSIINEYNNEPQVLTIDNFLLDNECEHFIKLSNKRLKLAKVVGKTETVLSKGRNNRNCWIEHNHDEITKRVVERISKLVKMPVSHAENYQIIHYAKNQKYDYHFDGFPIDDSDKSKIFMNKGGQRMKTALVYLNDVEEGGETGFRELNIIVKPKKGRLVLFENCYPNTNEPHPKSLHSGMPVIKGEKYAFNLWFREIPSNEIYDRSLIKPLKKDNNLKIGIISTIGKPFYFKYWLDYHLNKLKIDKIIVFYDRSNFPEMRELFNECKQEFKNLIVLDSNYHKKLITKQKLNFENGLKVAKSINLDFVFHIDDDELLYPTENIHKIINEYKFTKQALHFDNLEVLKTNLTTKNYNFFEKEVYFKNRGYKTFNSYCNGKAGGFVDNVKWNGPHILLNLDNHNYEENRIKILHYSFMIYEQWKNKYNIIDKNNKLDFPFHKKSAEGIMLFRNNKITENKLKEIYINLLSLGKPIESLLKDGIIIKIEISKLQSNLLQ